MRRNRCSKILALVSSSSSSSQLDTNANGNPENSLLSVDDDNLKRSKILSFVPSNSSSALSDINANGDPEISLLAVDDDNLLNITNLENISLSDLDFDSDDSLFDKDYVPTYTEMNAVSEESDSSTNTIPNSQSYRITIPESPEISSDEEIPQNLTKKGAIRKRKKYEQSLSQRKIMKKQKDIELKYKLKAGCNSFTCKKKCHYSFTEETRKSINKYYTNLSWQQQRLFIIHNTSTEIPKRNTIKANRKLPRNVSVLYYLPNEVGTKMNVCKVFFLETIGYNKSNDKPIRTALKFRIHTTPVDKRGTNSNPKKLDITKVSEHIMSFNPSISHYRRQHAPNRRYLPCDLTVKSMYEDYSNKHHDNPVSYELYRKTLKKLNISFSKLGHEECEICEKYFIHNPEYKELRHRNCKECRDYDSGHRKKFISARAAYKRDVEEQNKTNISSDIAYFAADLEKVIMLPRLEEFKIVMFCPRIIVFNESFVPIGDKQKNTALQTFAAIWHEATSGRKMTDIVSCFKAFLHANRDLKHIVIWLDNCAAQNKNWTLYSYLIHIVNSDEVSFEKITLKYLEVGHTYMAADEFHHQVELSMKRKKRIYDFEDFYKAVSDTRTNISVKVMNKEDFCQFEDCSSTSKLKNSSPRAYLSDMKEVTFHRGSNIIRYKTDFDNEQEYLLDFLKLKNIKNGVPPPKPIIKHRGITHERKSAIIQKLTPLMPPNRKSFWNNLPVDQNSVNLSEVYED